MRRINTSDVFKLARILKKGHVEDNIAKALEEVENSKGKKITEKVGIKIMLTLFESCGEPEVENLIYELFGGIAEVEPSSIADQEIEKTLEMFNDISKQNDLVNFFKQAGRLMKS